MNLLHWAWAAVEQSKKLHPPSFPQHFFWPPWRRSCGQGKTKWRRTHKDSESDCIISNVSADVALHDLLSFFLSSAWGDKKGSIEAPSLSISGICPVFNVAATLKFPGRFTQFGTFWSKNNPLQLMCRWTEWKHGEHKEGGVFFSWEKATFVAAVHSGLFPDTVGVEIGRCACSVIKSSLYNYWMLVERLCMLYFSISESFSEIKRCATRPKLCGHPNTKTIRDRWTPSS